MALKEDEREGDEFYQRMLARTYLKKGAGYCWLTKFNEAIENFTHASKFNKVFNEREIVEIQNDIDRIKIRQKSMQLKQEGDIKFAESNLEEATSLYEQCLEIDPTNEYIFANLGLIYMMKQDYEKCIEYSTKALDIMDEFLAETKSFQKENRVEVKILMRRGKSYEMLGDNEKAQADLDKALMLDPNNGEAKVIAKRVQDKLDTIAYEKFYTQAVEY